MISKSVKDHLSKNRIKTPNDFMVVVETNSEILKPLIKVDGIDEIEVDVQIPDENESKEGIKRKIFIPKVHGTDEIDVKKLDSAIKEVLDKFDLPEVFPNNQEISEMILSRILRPVRQTLTLLERRRQPLLFFCITDIYIVYIFCINIKKFHAVFILNCLVILGM